jgi:hypothetical protein
MIEETVLDTTIHAADADADPERDLSASGLASVAGFRST